MPEFTRRSYRLYELPAVTGLSDRTIRHAIAAGELKATKKSRRCTLVHVDDLDRWLRTEVRNLLDGAAS